MAKEIKCPKMFCGGIGIPASRKQGFKVGKAVVGNAIGFGLAGPVGGLVGIATGFNGKKKVQFVCSKCGHVWTEKI